MLECQWTRKRFLSSTFMVSSTDKQVQSAFSNKESIQKEVKATLSQKATLSCEVADTKTEVKWYKDGKLLTSSKTIHTESKGKSRQLVIDSVEKKDAGEYMCEAGTEKLVFKIHVEGKANAVCLINTKLRSLNPTCACYLLVHPSKLEKTVYF